MRYCILLIVMLLTGCGGGGGGSGSGSSPPPLPRASASLSVDNTQVVIGSAITVSWSSNNATSCSASNASGSSDWSGSKGTSGSESIIWQSVGAVQLTITCSGSGGSGTSTTSFDVLPVLEISVPELIGTQLEDTTSGYTVEVNYNRDPLSAPSLGITTNPANGTVSVDGLEVQYAPAENFFGDDEFNFEVTAEGETGIGVARISVSPVNDPPVLTLALADVNSQGFTFADPNVDFIIEIEDVDNSQDELSVEVISSEIMLEVSVEAGGASVSLPEDFEVGPTSFTFEVSDSEDSVSAQVDAWVVKTIEKLEEESGTRLSLFWGNATRDFDPIDYVIFLDGMTEATKESAMEMLSFYFSAYLSNGKDSLQHILDNVFNVYLVDFPASSESDLSVEVGCSDADENIYCVEDIIDAVSSTLNSFTSSPQADYTSVITGVEGRGVNLGSTNVQPLLNEIGENPQFGTPNYTMSVLKHEFGHAFMRLGDDYTADFNAEDEEGNKLVDMSDRLPVLDALYPNITLQNPASRIKWAHHIEEQIADGLVPGRDIEDDTSNLAVGAWAGCYVHDTECYRTTYNNIMNGDFTTTEEILQWEESRVLADSFSYDPIGEEAFVLATVRHFLDGDRSRIFTDSVNNIYVCAGVKPPSSLFKVDWYLNGVISEELKSSLVPGGTDDDLDCALVTPPEDGSSWSTIGVRINPASTDLFPELIATDDFNEFYDVYDGSFGGGFFSADCPLYDWHSDILEFRYCWSQSIVYLADQSFKSDPKMRSRGDYIDEYGPVIILWEESALGHQVQINWELL